MFIAAQFKIATLTNQAKCAKTTIDEDNIRCINTFSTIKINEVLCICREMGATRDNHFELERQIHVFSHLSFLDFIES